MNTTTGSFIETVLLYCPRCFRICIWFLWIQIPSMPFVWCDRFRFGSEEYSKHLAPKCRQESCSENSSPTLCSVFSLCLNRSKNVLMLAAPYERSWTIICIPNEMPTPNSCTIACSKYRQKDKNSSGQPTRWHGSNLAAFGFSSFPLVQVGHYWSPKFASWLSTDR